MLLDMLRFLLGTVSHFFALILLLRFYLQVARAPFKHPLAQFTVTLTNFAVIPIRRLVSSVRGYDSATLLLAWLVTLVSTLVLLWLSPFPYNFAAPQSWLVLALLATLKVFVLSLYLLMGALVVQAILSWVNPYNPLAPILDSLTRPYLRPFERLRIGAVELGPLVLLLILQMLVGIPLARLEWLLLSQMQMLM